MLELDKILIPFFDSNFDSMSEDGKDLFIHFLTKSDQQIFDWLFKDEIPDESRLHDLVLLIRYFAKSKDCKVVESV
jgi:antitoxin CptB